MTVKTRLPEILQHHQASLVSDWLARQREMLGHRASDEREDREVAERFVKALGEASRGGNLTDPGSGRMVPGPRPARRPLARARPPGLQPLRDGDLRLLAEAAAVRSPPAGGRQGRRRRSPTELWTATRAPGPAGALHDRGLPEGARGSDQPAAAGDAGALDAGRPALGWDPGAAADRHARQRPHPGRDGEPPPADRRDRGRIAIIDITGVPTVDTLVAQHLLKTVAAARLMGADCIISGIRPQIAQTIVHLGVDLGDVITKATLADALRVALERAWASASRGAPARPERARRDGTHSDPEDGRVPAGHDPGRHARPARHDASGRPHRADRPARARTASSSTSPRSRSWTRSSAG